MKPKCLLALSSELSLQGTRRQFLVLTHTFGTYLGIFGTYFRHRWHFWYLFKRLKVFFPKLSYFYLVLFLFKLYIFMQSDHSTFPFMVSRFGVMLMQAFPTPTFQNIFLYFLQTLNKSVCVCVYTCVFNPLVCTFVCDAKQRCN